MKTRSQDDMDAADALELALEEPVEIAHAWFDVTDAAAARALFERMGGTRPDGDGYVLTGLVDGVEGVPLAWVRIDADEVRLVSTYGELLVSARAFVETCDEEDVLYHVRSSIGDVRATLEMLMTERLDAGDAPDAAEAAVRDLLTTTMRCYFERWIHAPSAALDGRPPLLVAKKRKEPAISMLLGILALLDQQEAAAPWADGVAYDFGEVWRMLGLDREKAMDLR